MLYANSRIKYERPMSLTTALERNDNVYYIGIGSNMVVSKLKERSESYAIISAHPVKIRGYRLAFNVRGFPPLEPVYASIEPDDKSTCHGCLYEMTSEAYKKLWISEGGHVSPPVYQEVIVDAFLYNSETTVQAVALVCHPYHKLPKDHAPSQRYMNMLISGAQQLGIDANYISYLRTVPTYRISPLLQQLSLSLLFSHLSLLNCKFPIPFGAFRLFFQKYLYSPPSAPAVQRRIYDSFAILILICLPGTHIGTMLRLFNAVIGIPALPPVMKAAMTRSLST